MPKFCFQHKTQNLYTSPDYKNRWLQPVQAATVFSKLARVSIRTDEESYNYRTIWVKGHLVQPSCCGQGYLKLYQVAQSPIQSDLGYFQG